MFDPESPKSLQSLWHSIRWSLRKMEPHRKFRGELIKEYAGHAYSENSADREEHFNTWAMAIDTMSLAISGGTPQVQIMTEREDFLPFAATFATVLNSEIKRLKFGKTVEEWVLEMLFGGLGVLKIGTTDSHYAGILPGGLRNDTSSIYSCVVDLDDFVVDMQSRQWDRVDYIGDRYRCNYEDVLANEDFDPEVRKKVRPNKESDNNYEMPNLERSGDLYTDEDDDFGESHMMKYVDLWDIYIPRENLIVTLVDGQATLKPLLIQEYVGPANPLGPYYVLAGDKVPSNLLGRGPGHILKPMHDLINRLYRKLSRQAGNQKTVLMAASGSEQDAEKIRDADDCAIISVEDPSTIREANFLGPNQQNLAFAMHCYDVFNRLGGNIEAIGGLGPQSDTVGQDQMILGTVSRRIAKLSQGVLENVVKAIEDIGWRIWNDGEKIYRARRHVQGTSVWLPVELGPMDREGSLDDYDLTVAPFSLNYTSPGERSRAIMGMVTQVIMPALPLLQQQGLQFDFQRFFQLMAEQNSLPELNNLFTYTAPNPYQAEQGAGKPNTSKRTYERISRPGASRAGETQSMMQMAAGSKGGGATQPPAVMN